MYTPMNADQWIQPEPEEIEMAREAARPDHSDVCMEMGEALLLTRDPAVRREAVLWHAQAALLEEPAACYYLALECRRLQLHELARLHLNSGKYAMPEESERELENWDREDRAREENGDEDDVHTDEPVEVAELRSSVDLSEGESCLALGEAVLTLDERWAEEEALQWFIQAAILGEEGAHYRLGLCWQELRNRKMAEYHFRTAARKGHEEAALALSGGETEEIYALRAKAGNDDPEACYQLAEALAALDAKRYDEEVEKWLYKAAREDHPAAHYRLALRHREKDERTEAGYHLRNAAEQGYPPAEQLLIDWKIEGYHEFEDDDEALELLEAGAKRGNNFARYHLAGRIRDGRAGEIDPARVANLYRTAALGGHGPSQYEFAVCCQSGYGVKADPSKARHWMQEAAGRQDPDGLCGMGAIYRTAGDFAKAGQCFQLAADTGHPAAILALAQALHRGEGVARDETKARELVMLAAEKGNAEAQFQLGDYYAQGAAGLEQNDERAAEWYEHSADRNHLPAIRALAELILRRPDAERREIERAWNYIERAAQMGDVNCMLRLAGRIDRGEDPDLRKMDKATLEYQALHWYQRAADAGSPEAQYIAALRMLHVRHERERGIQYLKSAAEQGHAEAKKLLEDLGPEPEPAFEVPEVTALLSAAMAGDAASQFSLSMWHYNGYGVAQSFALCYFWAKVMSKVSPGDAAGLLEMVSPEVKASTRKKLDRHAEEWKPGLPPPSV